MYANREELISQTDNNAKKKDDKKKTIDLHVELWCSLAKDKTDDFVASKLSK